MFRQVGCLVGAVLLGYLSMATRQVSPAMTGGLLQASVLAGLTVAAIIFVPWDRLPSVVHRALPFVYLLVAVLARLTTSGQRRPSALSSRSFPCCGWRSTERSWSSA